MSILEKYSPPPASTDGTYHWDIFHEKDGSMQLIDRHLNFDVVYDVQEQIITGKVFKFHSEQIHPCVSMCNDGKCLHPLCQLTDKDFKSAADAHDPNEYVRDEALGKCVKIHHLGAITLLDEDGSQDNLDMNWRRLRNLARPIVDEQLAKLAMLGDWKTNRVRLNLGTLMLDNRIVRIDAGSCGQMKKDETNTDVADMEACCKSWNKKITREFMRRNVDQQEEPSPGKKRKTAFATYLEDINNSRKSSDDENKENKVTTVVARKRKKDETVVGELVVLKKEGDVAADGGDTLFCRQCIESPCVWKEKEEDMRLFDVSEHGHLQADDLPPNNIRRKKVYRQMFLYINQGPAGKGVRMKLPTCVENGARLMFPSPTFMGFRDM
jgi:hypothetical protein